MAGDAVSKEKLRGKIAYIEDCLGELERLAALPPERFFSDRVFFHAAVRLFQTAIEAMIDAANHIAARERLGAPRTYFEAFQLLAKGGIVPREFLPTLEKMVRFRNRAVHLYEELAPEAVYEILRSNLGDFREFVGYLVRRYF